MKAARVLMPISQIMIKDNQPDHLYKSQNGFTLIEMVIVAGILAGMFALILPRISFKQNEVRKTSRDFIVLAKDIRNQARTSGRTHRLVMELGETTTKYWVETAPGLVLPKSEKEVKENENKSVKDQFERSKRFFKNSKENERLMTSKARIKQVENSSLSRPISQGLAYIYFSPQGLVQKSAIQLTDGEKVTWTLLFNPLTGQTNVIEKEFALKDVKVE